MVRVVVLSRAVHAHRNMLCALYGVWMLKQLAAQLPADISIAAELWAPPLWRLLFAEPPGADFWVRARQ